MKYLNDIKVINDICTKINYSKTQKYFVEKCASLFSAIEIVFDSYWKYASTKNLLSPNSQRSMSRPRKNIKFSETTLSLLNRKEIDDLISSKIFTDLIYFRPHIMSDEILGNERYNPKNISAELKLKAAKTHYDLIESNLVRDRKMQIIRLCKLLYMVRSNLMHCGKTPYGPDLEKSDRDEKICEVVYPILMFLMNSFLDYPNHKLIIYGTLMTEGVNHNLIKDLASNLKKVRVLGYIENINSLPYYSYSLTSEKIDVELLENQKLTKKFEELDRFEGGNYQREFIPYLLGSNIGVANVYSKRSA